MKIAVDAMGGDHAPGVVVDGAVQAARDLGLELILVGRRHVIEAELAAYDTAGLSLQIQHAEQIVAMDEHNPAAAVKASKDSSMVLGMETVKRGEAEAFVTAGHSGAALAAALFRLGRIRGIKRPALSTVFPSQTPQGHCFILDIGANADCKPEYLLQFAVMGAIYAERVLGVTRPRVAIVSNGEEEGKGNQLVQETVPLLRASTLNFVGNAEGKDIPWGIADVIVTDGFTGNVIIKLSEGVSKLLMDVLKTELTSRNVSKIGALLAKPAFDAVRSRLDYREYGGAPLLGIDGVVIVGHGRSDALAIRNAIRVAAQTVENSVLEAIKQGLAEQGVSRGLEALVE
ncbi:MAG TPA: phosphate acyltransferase PlsX [Anaerolineae bacterium]|nr:phosphate acyltransferase PlsX [Anaerolineae bacterium]